MTPPARLPLEAPPAWAATLSVGAVEPALVAQAVRLAASGWADAVRLRQAVAGLIDRGRDPDVGEVLDALEGLRPRGRALAAPAEWAAAGEALAAARARVLLAGRPGYPSRLADAWPDLGAPAWLFARTAEGGALPEKPAVAVVGTRRPSLDGLATARALGRLLGRAGVTVVSGLARGVDQAAHQGAIDAGGSTVAVLGTGLDVDYPRGDAAVRDAIAESGGLVTELACGAPPKPAHFLQRNRIIAGLAELTVVVEGQARSGSLHTARLAAAQGRDVWAVPGSVNAPTSRGPLDLIRDGAQVVTRLGDVLDAVERLPGRRPQAVDAPAGAAPTAALSGDARTVLGLLGPVPAAPGRLATAAGLPVAGVLAALSELTGRGLASAGPRGVVATHHPPVGG